MALAIQLTPIKGFCWSAPGHEAIAIAAMQLLKGTPTEAKINSILDGESPTNAAIWLDLVREHRLTDPAAKAEAKSFDHDFPHNSDWHFCNFIVGSTNYDFNSIYSSEDDVVHALENAIAVLEGANSKMTQKQALRVVFHLVGDIHQPLHCITGFYDTNNPSQPLLLTNVIDPHSAVQDRGGNQLYYTTNSELHALWDLGLPNSISHNIDTLAQKLVVPSWANTMLTDGDYHHWAEAWAGDSMNQANAAYEGIVFKSAAQVPDPRHPGETMLKILIKLPGGTSGYEQAQKQRTQEQLTKASVHLAQLLSKINFQ
jgi:S1/P1 Nuclease